VATTVYSTIEIELLDGTTVTVKPLSIKNLRLLMREWNKVTEVENEDQFLDTLLKCTKIALSQFITDVTEEQLEEILDLQTMYKVLEIAADIKLNDPNLLAVAQDSLGRNLT
jgi:hypothetical protein